MNDAEIVANAHQWMTNWHGRKPPTPRQAAKAKRHYEQHGEKLDAAAEWGGGTRVPRDVAARFNLSR